MPAKSINSVSSVQAKKTYCEWVRTVRKERPPVGMEEYLQDWKVFFDHYAAEADHWHRRNAGYHKAIARLARFYVPAGARVLEVGSGNGDLLEALQPSYGVGIDISGETIHLAARKYPHLKFLHMPAERLDLPGELFDFIILPDLLGYLYDIRLVFERLRTVCHPRTRLIVHWYSRLWHPVLVLAEKLGLKYPQPLVNWTTVEDVSNLLSLSGFEVVHRRQHMLLPKRVPFLSTFANRY
jgi:SAM-dependent methyltransferase